MDYKIVLESLDAARTSLDRSIEAAGEGVVADILRQANRLVKLEQRYLRRRQGQASQEEAGAEKRRAIDARINGWPK